MAPQKTWKIWNADLQLPHMKYYDRHINVLENLYYIADGMMDLIPAGHN